MRSVSISASPKQLSKLRNGHRVRIKQGTGFNVVVNPTTYRLVARTFAKNKGIDIALSPEEIEMNKLYSPERHREIASMMEQEGEPAPMSGTGIFSKIKKGFKKAGKEISKGAKAVWKVSKPVLKPIGHELVKQGIKYIPQVLEGGLTAGAMALGQPELVPAAKIVGNIAGKELQKQAGRQNDKYLGRGFVRQGKYHTMPVNLSEMQYLRRHSAEPIQAYYNAPLEPPSRGPGGGAGLYAGRGLYAGTTSGRGNMGCGLFAGGAVDVGLNGGFVRRLPPALQSQPYSANYHFQFQLPPQYQGYEQGPGMEFY